MSCFDRQAATPSATGSHTCVHAHACRFAEAEQALSKALQANGAAAKDEMALAHRLETHKGVVESLVTHFASEGEPQFYVEAFERLANWVYNSLDLYRVRV